MKRIFLFVIIFYSGYTFYAQEILTISDFFKNDRGEIKISKVNKKKLKTILGSYYYCALYNCLHEEECNILKTVELLILECQNKEKKFIKDYELISILEKRNKDSLSRMNISFDTSEFRKDFHSIQDRLEKIKHKVYYKNKISIYFRQNTFDTTGLKKFLLNIEELKKEEQQINQIGEKATKTIANWSIILDSLEKNRVQLEEKKAQLESKKVQLEKERKLIAQEIWLNFVTSQMRLKWDEKQKELARNEKQKEDEKQRFSNWKKNTRFSISYKIEIVKSVKKCSYCNNKEVLTNVIFPDLNFSIYGNENYIKNLWNEHKQVVKKEIGHSGISIFGNIINDDCSRCGSEMKNEKNVIYRNKIFKN
jgi:hypothetical protein